jgi:repressor LexA
MPPRLTELRIGLLTRLSQLARAQGGPPSAAELAQAAQLTPATISFHLKALRELGYVERPSGSGHERLRLTEAGRRVAGDGIPVYGSVAAGPPILAEQDPDRTVASLDALLGVRPGDFLLEVRGLSMTGVGIMDGDYVLVRPQAEVHDGEIAVVLLPGQDAATLKRLYHLHDEIILVAENPDVPQMAFPASEVQVQGKLVGVVGLPRARQSYSPRQSDSPPREH